MESAETKIFFEELKKRVSVTDEELESFSHLWELKSFKKNEFILKAGEIPKFSIFVLEGSLRQYSVNEKGEESIVYFAEERHFIGDLPALRNKVSSDFNFQSIEACKLLILTAENCER
ncbi:MAG: Crp/Fnr family transcriptional regulator, partial [Bacteroidia bacterium]